MKKRKKGKSLRSQIYELKEQKIKKMTTRITRDNPPYLFELNQLDGNRVHVFFTDTENHWQFVTTRSFGRLRDDTAYQITLFKKDLEKKQREQEKNEDE